MKIEQHTSHTQQRNLNHQLYLALNRSSLREVEEVLNQGADANSIGDMNRPILICVIQDNPAKIDLPERVRLLVEHGADVNSRHPETQMTPLHIVAMGIHVKITEMLLDNKANPNLQDRDGNSPMHIAAMKGKAEHLKRLNEKGGNPFLQNRLHLSPFTVGMVTATKQAHLPAMQQLHDVIKNITAPSRQIIKQVEDEIQKTTRLPGTLADMEVWINKQDCKDEERTPETTHTEKKNPQPDVWKRLSEVENLLAEIKQELQANRESKEPSKTKTEPTEGGDEIKPPLQKTETQVKETPNNSGERVEQPTKEARETHETEKTRTEPTATKAEQGEIQKETPTFRAHEETAEELEVPPDLKESLEQKHTETKPKPNLTERAAAGNTHAMLIALKEHKFDLAELEEALLVSIEQNQQGSIEFLAQCGCSITEEMVNKAIEINNNWALNSLLEHGGNLEPNAETTAMWIESGRTELIRILLKHRQLNSHLKEILGWAIVENQPLMAEACITAGVDLEKTITELQKMGVDERIIRQTKSLQNKKEPQKHTPQQKGWANELFWKGINEGNPNWLDAARQQGIELNQFSKDGTPAIIAAAEIAPEAKAYAVTEWLLNHKTPPDTEPTNLYGDSSALHTALRLKKTQVALLLLNHGADANKTDRNGATPLHIVTEENGPELINALLARGAKPMAKDQNGVSALTKMWAEWKNTEPLHHISINQTTAETFIEEIELSQASTARKIEAKKWAEDLQPKSDRPKANPIHNLGVPLSALRKIGAIRRPKS